MIRVLKAFNCNCYLDGKAFSLHALIWKVLGFQEILNELCPVRLQKPPPPPTAQTHQFYWQPNFLSSYCVQHKCAFKHVPLCGFLELRVVFVQKATASVKTFFNLLYEISHPYVIFLYFIFRSKVNKGIGVENIHYLNDGLWQMKTIK